jgi:1,4-dihydroxy-2-naphthoate octaprenyltransferase
VKAKLKAHLWTLPRWFAAPFFGSAVLLGAVLAGGINLNAWLATIAGLLVMAGGHSFNSFLDYSWTGLDKGELEDRSAEKDYCGGQNIIEAGIVSTGEVAANALVWYLLSAAPAIYLALAVGWQVIIVWLLGMLVTFWYSKAKFNWTHELALGAGSGPLAVLLGMFGVTSSPDWVAGLLASLPIAILFAFAGLALDEWPDAEANLKKGVKSIAYKVWENKVDLLSYITAWIAAGYIFQLFLIVVGILAPLTFLTFILLPVAIPCMVFFKSNFRKAAGVFVLIAGFYPILMLVGQIVGG